MEEIFRHSRMSENNVIVEIVENAKRGHILIVRGKDNTLKVLRIYDASSHLSVCGIDAAIIRTMQTAAMYHPNLVDVLDIELVFDTECSHVRNPRCRIAHLLILSNKGERNLKSWIKQKVRWTGEKEIALVMNDVTQAMAYIHRNGYTHPKLQPTNIVISPKNGVYRAKVSDFQDLTIFSHEKNYVDEAFEEDMTPYRAPEILSGTSENTQQSDVWSLGIIFFEILFGRTPFEGSEENPGLFRQVFGRRQKRSDLILSNIMSWIGQSDDNLTTFSVKKHILNSDFVQLIEQSRGREYSISQESFVLFVDLIDQCLRLRPTDRISSKAILHHPLFTYFNMKTISGKSKTLLTDRTKLDMTHPLHTSFQTVRSDLIRNAEEDVETHYMSYEPTLMAIYLFDRVMPSMWDRVTAHGSLQSELIRSIFCAAYLIGLKSMSSHSSEMAFKCLAGIICVQTKDSRLEVVQLERDIISELKCMLYPSCILSSKPPLHTLITRSLFDGVSTK